MLGAVRRERDNTLFERMLASTKEFFALPLEEKMRSYIGLSQCHRGYAPVGEEGVESGTPDLKEAFDTALDLPADDPTILRATRCSAPTHGRTCRASPMR